MNGRGAAGRSCGCRRLDMNCGVAGLDTIDRVKHGGLNDGDGPSEDQGLVLSKFASISKVGSNR